MIKVALTFYEHGPEQTFWNVMPAIPRIGDTVHFSLTGDLDDSRAWRVFNVSWVQLEVTAPEGGPGQWHVELALR